MMRALLLCLGLLVAPVANTAGVPYNSIHVFGDSLSDGGNAWVLSAGEYPQSPPYARRFSNGPVAAEYLASAIGVPLAPSTAGGGNFAVGGATTGVANYVYEISPPGEGIAALDRTGVLAQASAFAASPPPFDPARALFMIWAGPNDFFLALAQGTDPVSAVSAAVTNLVSTIGVLAATGATDFFVPNMPNLARTPLGLAQDAAGREGLNLLSNAFNEGLAGALELARSGLLPGIPAGLELMSFDVAGYFDEVIAEPGRYGFTDVTTPCAALAAGCDGHLFFDDVHPTSAGHRMLAGQFVSAVPEPHTVVMMGAGLVLVWSRARRHVGSAGVVSRTLA